jgi:hypothetical protein
MKNYYLCSTILLLLFINLSFAQKNKEELNNAYAEYFNLDRESVYLHLNKTTFVKGDKIWFSAYIFDKKNGQPFTATTNLLCAIYDNTGKQLDQKIFYVNRGFVIGLLDIPLNLASEEFYLKASTNWMKNFEEEGAFIQRLFILDTKIEYTQEKKEAQNYQILLFPEGGQLVQDTENSIGFMVIDSNGKGIPIKNAQLISNNDVVLEEIKTDKHGIGKFRSFLSPDSNYSLEVQVLDTIKISKPLPELQKEGITVSINNLLEEKIAIVITTNKATLDQLSNKQLYAAIHRDGLLSLSSFKLESTQKTFDIGTEDLLPGINIFTLFDHHLNPIAERLFFNINSTKIGEVHPVYEAQNVLNDSIKVKLNLYSKNSSPTQLSISVLPNETRANSNHKSIFSSFLFEPYIKSEVANPEYYLKNTTRVKRYELDNLLITKGWSKYNWENIFKNPKIEKFEFERGIAISGNVSNANTKRFKMVVNDSLNQYQYFTEIDSLKNFEISDAIFFKDNSIEARLFDLNGGIIKPKLEIFPLISSKKDSLNIPFLKDNFSLNEIEEIENNLENYQKKMDNIIRLDNVTVSKPRAKNKYIAISPYSMMTTVFPESEIGTISGFMIKMGFTTTIINPEIGIPDGKKHVPGVAVIVDGYFEDGFYDKRIEEVFAISYQRPSGPIIIISKQSKPIALVAKYLLKEGFEQPEVFYNQDYNSLDTKQYLEYATIFWEGQLKIEENGTHEFMIPNNGLKNLKLFIEGMSEDGTLFSETKNIYLD